LNKKVLFISLFLVFGIVLSGLLTMTSLSLTKQIKSTFGEEKNVEFDGFANPPAGEMTVLEDKVGVDEGIPVVTFLKDKFSPFLSSNPLNMNKTVAFYIPLLILLFITSYFVAKRFKKERKKGKNNYENEETQKQTVAIKNIVKKDIPPLIKEKRVATNNQINETRRLLKKWEARLTGGETKKDAETINEWFKRINGPIEIIPIYEKVRYGEKTCTEDELRFIKNTLQL